MMTSFGGTFIHYKASVADALIERKCYVSPEWFREQTSKLLFAYDLGEPVSVIADTLALFSLGARKPKTARQIAVRVVRVPG